MEWLGTRASQAGISPGNWQLCVGPAVLRALDYGLTLCGQPAAYWEGNLARVHEGSWLLRWCLHQHPLVFVLAGVILTALSSLFLLSLSRHSAQLLAVFMMCAHIYGVFSWVMVSPALGVPAFLALLYFCLSLMRATEEQLPVLGRQTRLAHAADSPCS